MKTKKTPMRMCVGCRESRDKRELIRVVRSPEGEVSLDSTGKKPGRGAYVCRKAECLKLAIKRRQLERQLEITLTEEVSRGLQEAMEQAQAAEKQDE
ncbi:MAG: YlxR family protein [Clostridia bacterium]|nr:YlxR family protein [Clostridia bacterium]